MAAAIRAAAPDRKTGDLLVHRYGVAYDALDHDRMPEARRVVKGLVGAVPTVGAVHALAGLIAYRSGRWRDAVRSFEEAELTDPSVERWPLLADSYRALKRFTEVERVWLDIRNASPAPDVLAEGRIVAAGAASDQGQLAAAIELLTPAATSPRKVRPHHLRQWYALADLYDRSGDPIKAAEYFERIAAHDREFVDVADRLHALGR